MIDKILSMMQRMPMYISLCVGFVLVVYFGIIPRYRRISFFGAMSLAFYPMSSRSLFIISFAAIAMGFLLCVYGGVHALSPFSVLYFHCSILFGGGAMACAILSVRHVRLSGKIWLRIDSPDRASVHFCASLSRGLLKGALERVSTAACEAQEILANDNIKFLEFRSPFFVRKDKKMDVARINKWQAAICKRIPGAVFSRYTEAPLSAGNSILIRLRYGSLSKKFPKKSGLRVPAAGFIIQLP